MLWKCNEESCAVESLHTLFKVDRHGFDIKLTKRKRKPRKQKLVKQFKVEESQHSAHS